MDLRGKTAVEKCKSEFFKGKVEKIALANGEIIESCKTRSSGGVDWSNIYVWVADVPGGIVKVNESGFGQADITYTYLSYKAKAKK